MEKINLKAALLIGLMTGQLFAENERPVKVVNTVRVGYSDNLYRNEKEKEGSFVNDTVDLSFKAVLSDRTDVMAKSQFTFSDDDGGTDFYPNLYAMLNHSVSPRLLLRLSEYYRSSEKSGTDVKNPKKNERYDYFYNNVGILADYVLTGNDRLGGSFDYSILRHDKEIDTLDYTTIAGGLSWQKTLSPQRTFSTLNLRQQRVTYDNQPKDDPPHRVYLQDDAYYDATELSAGLNHTFNQQWQGKFEAGATRVMPHFSDVVEDGKLHGAPNETTLNPLVRAGLVYSPSPRTRLNADFSHQYQESDDDGYGGQTTSELKFGAQHDLTAKLMAKASARFAATSYDEQDSTTGSATDRDEERVDLEFRLTYKLNRMHFIEAGILHREKSDDTDDGDWEENRVDIGWRVELN